MTKYLAIFSGFCCVVLPAAGQTPTQATPDLSALLVIDSVAPGPSLVSYPGSSDSYLPVAARMHNAGSKAITAFRVSLYLGYPDGTSSEQGWTVDLAFPIAEARMPGVLPIPNSTLNPGDVYTLTQSVRLQRGQAWPTQITPKVALLVFGDATGLGDSKSVAMVFQGRRETSQRLASLLSQVNEAEASPNPEQRYHELISAARSQASRGAPGSAASGTDLGPYGPRLEKYLAIRGTAQFGLMLQVDQAAQRGLAEMSVQGAGQAGVLK
jgi:hypothetical protein